MRGFLSQPKQPRHSKTSSGGSFDITTAPSYLAAYSFLLGDSKLVKDLGSSGASANGDAIAKVKEWSNNGRDLVNTNGTDKPLVVTNGISFDGSDDYLRCAAFSGGSAVSSMTVGIRFSLDSAVANQGDGGRLLSFHGAGSLGTPDYLTAPLLAVQYPGNQSSFDTLEPYGPGAPSLPDLQPGSVAFGTLCTLIMVYDNSAGGAYINGSFSSWNKGSSTYDLTYFSTSATDYGSSISGGKIPMTLRRMVICAAALGSTDRANITSWLEA